MGKGCKDLVQGDFHSSADEARGFSLELCGTARQALPTSFLNELPEWLTLKACPDNYGCWPEIGMFP